MKTDRLYHTQGLFSRNGGNEVKSFLSDFKPNEKEKERLRHVAQKIRLLTRSHGIENIQIAFLALDSNGKPNFQNRYHHSFYISERMTEKQAVLFFNITISNYFIFLGEL